MIVIVNHVMLKDEEGNKGVVVKEQDIKELLRYGLRIGFLTASNDITAFLGQSTRI